MENPRNQISDLHFDKFPYSSDFQCWKTNFMTEVCSNSGVPQSQCCGSKKWRWPNQWTIFERRSQLKGVTSLIMLDAKIASALKRIISNQYFRRRVYVEERDAQKNDRFSTRKTDCLHDLRPFSSNRRSWRSSSPIRSLQCFLTRRCHSGFRYQMGPSSTICKRSTWRKRPGEFEQDWDTRVCSASDCISDVWTRNWSRPSNAKLSKIEYYGKKTHCSDDQDAQLQSPKWKDWDRDVSQESQRKERQRWKENGRMSSVEGKRTAFKRRLLQFSPRKWSWTTSTIVLSCSKGADTDWRKKTLERHWPQGRKPFWKERSESVQK